MSVSVGLDRILEATAKEQESEDEKKRERKNDESEKSFMDYMELGTEFISDDPELITSPERNLKNYYTPQDAAYWEEEVKDVMESVKRVHEALSEGGKIEEVFRFHPEECGDQKKEIKNEKDLKISIEEIEKMDTILKAKINEEKKARLSRIQVEEESRNILTTLPFAKMSGGMKFNLDEFMKLLNDVDSTDHDSLLSCKETGECGGDELKEEDRKEKTTGQKINYPKFVERNIQLAKCGCGTLSLTDEEKSRIESLLADVECSIAGRVEGPEEAKGVSSTEKKPENFEKIIYGIDDETKTILSQIDERLETMAEANWLNKNDRLKKVIEGNEKGKREEKEERSRLKKINQLLKSVNSVSGEEIHPLTDEELENLIRESKEILTQESALEEEIQSAKNRLDITELVSSAKSLMPKFKYRFSDN